jgi:NAD(P)H dehydrogenase (quinone)
VFPGALRWRAICRGMLQPTQPPHPTSVVKKLIKMLVHIINAHPCPNSFGGAIHRHIVEVLVVNGHQIDDLDLYAERFDPVLTSRERDVYFDPAANLTGVKTYVERLRSAEALVLCFPTWWYGMPAILKGWFDRVWLPGVAFHNPPQGGPIKRGLVNIQKLAAVTSYNSPRWFMLFYMRDPGKTVLMRGFTRLIAPGARTHYLAHYDMLRSTEVSRKRFLARVDQTFASF